MHKALGSIPGIVKETTSVQTLADFRKLSAFRD
jgi:hypothetical protein